MQSTWFHFKSTISVTFAPVSTNNLSNKQWNALKAYYITHNQRLSMQKIADKMEISKESLRDRISGAKKKIKKYFETHAPDGVPLPELMFGFSHLVKVPETDSSEKFTEYSLQ